MRLSTKGRYAVMAMADLARRQAALAEGDTSATLPVLARNDEIADQTRALQSLRAAEDALFAARARLAEADAALDYERTLYNEARVAAGEDPLEV